jgi:hypothetical protein
MSSGQWHTTSTPLAPAAQCTIMAGRLTVRADRHLPMLLRWAWRTRRQLRNTPGLAGYAVQAELRTKTLWIVSAWISRTDLARFDRGDLHAAAKATIRPTLAPSTFVLWSSSAGELPIGWPEVRRRIAAAGRNRPHPSQ